jgi:hypothetical protein
MVETASAKEVNVVFVVIALFQLLEVVLRWCGGFVDVAAAVAAILVSVGAGPLVLAKTRPFRDSRESGRRWDGAPPASNEPSPGFEMTMSFRGMLPQRRTLTEIRPSRREDEVVVGSAMASQILCVRRDCEVLRTRGCGLVRVWACVVKKAKEPSRREGRDPDGVSFASFCDGFNKSIERV